MTRLGRYILSEIGIVPQGLVTPVREQLEEETGNSSAISQAALLDHLKSLEKQLQEATGVAIPR